jgi:putative ABC transport system permease protein
MPGRLIEVFGQALRTMLRRPAQSALTVLGLTIGVGAFIAMVSFGEGARRTVLSQFEALGANLLKVNPLGIQQTRGAAPRPLTDRDVAAIRREASTIVFAAPVARTGANVGYGGERHWATLYGTLPRFAALHVWHASSGGMYDDVDLAQRAKVCVLGATPARELFGEGDPLGETVTLRDALPCRVIGLLATKGYATNGDDLDNIVLVPITTYDAYLGDGTGVYSYLEVEPASPALLEFAKAEVSAALRRAHALGSADMDDFTVSSPLEVVRAVERTSSILTRLLLGIAALSLLVGGIGIMNIQLVSVAERTEEIGIRSAIGASPRQLLGQFLAEAGALSTTGAACGVLLGVSVASLVARWMGWPRVIAPVGVVGSAAFGIAVGLVFGYLPARRASRLDPVEALRHE